jgi:protein ImuA
MAVASPPITIAELRRSLERLEAHDLASTLVLPFGLPELDQHLPKGGLQLGHLHEVSEAGPESKFMGLAPLFVGGILARLQGPVLWCLHGRDLFAPALARVGLHPDRVIYCETWNDRDVLPAMEEGLRCRGLAGVVGELVRLPLTASRRLQLAAGQSGVTAFALRRFRNANEEARASEPNAAATRWRISAVASPGAGFDGLPPQHWLLELVRARGGEGRSWRVEACNAQGHLTLPAALADRPAAPKRRKRAATG